jgi:Na+/melibiose symporter-like transporter
MFVMGMQMHRVRDCGQFFRRFAFLTRSPIIFIAPALLLGIAGIPAVIWFICMQSLFFFADGLVALCWQSVNAHTIAPRDRGPVQGYQQFISALVGLLSASVIKALMDSPLEPNLRYALIFGAGGVIYIVNAFLLRQIKDIPLEEPARLPAPTLGGYLRGLLALWRERRDFRRILYGRLLFNSSLMATSILLLFGARDMALTPEQISSMIYVQIAGQLVGGPLFGLINRHLGNAKTMLLGNLFSVLVGALGVGLFLAPRGAPPFWPVAALIFTASAQQVSYMGYVNAVYERMPKDVLPGYMVLQQLMLLPLTALPYLAGLLAQQVSFLPLFILVAALGLGGTAHALRFARDARLGRLDESIAGEVRT